MFITGCVPPQEGTKAIHYIVTVQDLLPCRVLKCPAGAAEFDLSNVAVPNQNIL